VVAGIDRRTCDVPFVSFRRAVFSLSVRSSHWVMRVYGSGGRLEVQSNGPGGGSLGAVAARPELLHKETQARRT